MLPYIFNKWIAHFQVIEIVWSEFHSHTDSATVLFCGLRIVLFGASKYHAIDAINIFVKRQSITVFQLFWFYNSITKNKLIFDFGISWCMCDSSYLYRIYYSPALLLSEKLFKYHITISSSTISRLRSASIAAPCRITKVYHYLINLNH